MTTVGQRERATQDRVIALFQEQLGYTYLGNWEDEERSRPVENELIQAYLKKMRYSGQEIARALSNLYKSQSIGKGSNLYDANKATYEILRYGTKVPPGVGLPVKTVKFINWKEPLKNDFAIAEEVSVKGENNKRPDIVLYVNGIAVGVLELKRSCVSVSEGIRQNIDNQKKAFIRNFFTTIQLVMAGNDTEGLRYGTIQTPEKYYLTWKEENPDHDPQADDRDHKYLPDRGYEGVDSPLDLALVRLCDKQRLLEIIHDFIVFDAGTKKTCRHSQYFGVRAGMKRVQKREGGIIWHMQGSGKSLTMVWLAKWIRENVANPRVLIVTDRTELDEQIEKVFLGVGESIYRTKSGADLIHTLNKPEEWLMCSLVHKFGGSSEREIDIATDEFIKEIQANIPSDFQAKGDLFIFVDECHRTQSGKLHDAMVDILPNAMFIGFTGTPLLKVDKRTSLEVFGSFIHTYKLDEAVNDNIVLDLRYEARDIDQCITSQKRIDEWFEMKTAGLSDMAKFRLRQKWGTMQKVLSSKSRLEQIVNDILIDMETRPRLMDGRGNAMLVCASIYEACKVFELFSATKFENRCAIVTSYRPSTADIKGQDSGAGMNEEFRKYHIYRKMLADFFDVSEDDAMGKVEEFEKQVKEKFIKEPGQMRLLIVVDKLLTGFDAPSATYLYIDKDMRDHGLFQAICRVNRLDGDDKEYGYIIDYKDLFQHLECAIDDYTGGALDGYDKEDVAGLLTDRLERGREHLEETREKIKALCEPVSMPRDTADYIHYFCSNDTLDKNALQENEPRRVELYKETSALVRAYANLANELEAAGYTKEEVGQIKIEVEHYSKVREEVSLAAGETIDLKQYEPDMRYLLDMYIRAEESEIVEKFDDLGLLDLIVNNGLRALDNLPESIRKNEDIMAEVIESNLRKVIVDKQSVNPKYYERMSEVLDALIEERRKGALDYKVYLEHIKKLAEETQSETSVGYPVRLNTRAKQALFDNLEGNQNLAIAIDEVVRNTKKDRWIGNQRKEMELRNAVQERLGPDLESKLDEIMELLKNQHEYK